MPPPRRGDDFTVYEAASTVGGHVRSWGHVRTFTPWAMNVSPRMRAAVPDAPASDALPSGAQLADELLEPVAATAQLAGRIRLDTRVLAIGREGLLKHEAIGDPRRAARPFRLLLVRPDGSEAIANADVVIDATGTYGNPNRLGDGGIDAVNERAFEDRIERFLPRLDAAAGDVGRQDDPPDGLRALRADRGAPARGVRARRARHAGRVGGAQGAARLGRRERRPAARARVAQRIGRRARRRRVGCRVDAPRLRHRGTARARRADRRDAAKRRTGRGRGRPRPRAPRRRRRPRAVPSAAGPRVLRDVRAR